MALVHPTSPHSLRPLAAATIVFAAALAAGCTAIDTYAPTLRSFGVYKLDINQGNYLSQDQVNKLKVGQTKSQVVQLLGTPLIISAFRDTRWDYVYAFTRQGKVLEQRTFTAYFVDNKLARWEGDEMPPSVAELNKTAAARTAGEDAWSDERSFLERIVDYIRN